VTTATDYARDLPTGLYRKTVTHSITNRGARRSRVARPSCFA
jgi:hypothetical protein